MLKNEEDKLLIPLYEIILIFSFLMALSSLVVAHEVFKYPKYLILPMSIILIFVRKRHDAYDVGRKFFFGWFILLGYSFITYVVEPKINGLKDIFFILTYVVPLYLFHDAKMNMEKIWAIFVACWFISILFVDFGELSIYDSSAIYESPASFTFGAFAIYYFSIGNKKLFLFNFFLMVLTLKRIAFVGVFFVIFSSCMPYFFKNLFTGRFVVTIFVLISFLLIVLFSSGALDPLVFLLTGQTSSQISLGRFDIYQEVYFNIVSKPHLLLIGDGIGSTYGMLNNHHEIKFSYDNLHSDILKIGYEVGLPAMVVFCYLFLTLRNVKSRSVAIYTLVIFLTDNVLIWSSVMFYNLLIILKLEWMNLQYDEKNVAR